jgi:hydroxyethylthiazole kinase-like uncharacterized protein yjeF
MDILWHNMITVKEMRALEKDAHQHGIFNDQLMENAGKEFVQVVKEKYDLTDYHVIIFAGTGNNGGDGFVAAKYLSEDYPTVVLLFGTSEKLTEEAREKYDKVKESVTIVQITDKNDLDKFHTQESLRLLLIDAMLGIGLSGEVHEPISFGIDKFNSMKGLKVAMDIPSGMNADTGEVMGSSCDVELIVTLHALKVGMESVRDKTVVVDIGIPHNQ